MVQGQVIWSFSSPSFSDLRMGKSPGGFKSGLITQISEKKRQQDRGYDVSLRDRIGFDFLALPLVSCAALGKLLNLSESQFLSSEKMIIIPQRSFVRMGCMESLCLVHGTWLSG